MAKVAGVDDEEDDDLEQENLENYEMIKDNIEGLVQDYTNGEYDEYSVDEIFNWINQRYFGGNLIEGSDVYNDVYRAIEEEHSKGSNL